MYIYIQIDMNRNNKYKGLSNDVYNNELQYCRLLTGIHSVLVLCDNVGSHCLNVSVFVVST